MNSQPGEETSQSRMPIRLGTRAKLNNLLSRRWSPRAFSAQPVEPWKILNLFEAARWAPSASNEQPWRFIVATKEDTHTYESLYNTLSEGNQKWAHRAPILALAVAHSVYSRNQKPNRHSWYDLGQSVANLSLEATALGLSVHQMGGFDAAKVKERLMIPPDFDPVAIFAIGYTDRPETLPDDLRQREEAPRSRLPLENVVFTDEWGQPSRHINSRSTMRDISPSTN